MTRRTRPRAAATLLFTTFTALTMTGCGASSGPPAPGSTRKDGSSMHVVQPATARKTQAEQLIAAVAHDVSPGATVAPNGPGATLGPSKCSSPLTGEVYYTISRQFDAPDGKAGADLVSALRAAFGKRGFKTGEMNTRGKFISFSGQTQHVGFEVLAYKASRLIQVNLDTECGSPPASGEGTPSTDG